MTDCPECRELGAELCGMCTVELLRQEAAYNPRPATWTVEDANENGWWEA